MISWLRRTFRRRRPPQPRNISKQGAYISAPAGNNSSQRCFQVIVVLLDSTTVTVEVPKKQKGVDLMNRVSGYVDVIGTEQHYFGLQFMDVHNVPQWIEEDKEVRKQVKIGPPYTLHFRVRFYPSEPDLQLKEELTRYQVFLQLKQDLCVPTRLGNAPRQIQVELSGLSLQSELGNYDSKTHDPHFISEFRFIPEEKQDENFELDVLDYYKSDQCNGKRPAEAELDFLSKSKWLTMYGVDMHLVTAKDNNEYKLGLTPTGVLIYERSGNSWDEGEKKIGLFFWNKIKRLDFRSNRLMLDVGEELANGQEKTHSFIFRTHHKKACKHLWKCAVQCHQFFRLKNGVATNRGKPIFGRGDDRRRTTEYGIITSGSNFQRRGTDFKRQPSKRYSRRNTFNSYGPRKVEVNSSSSIGNNKQPITRSNPNLNGGNHNKNTRNHQQLQQSNSSSNQNGNFSQNSNFNQNTSFQNTSNFHRPAGLGAGNAPSQGIPGGGNNASYRNMEIVTNSKSNATPVFTTQI